MVLSSRNKMPALADQAIESNSVEQELRRLQYNLDMKLHQLRGKFINEENSLREQYLRDVEKIMQGSNDE